MSEISILAIDLAKHNFQVCATTCEGEVIYNRKYTRARLTKLLESHDTCIVAMEACGTSNYWGRLAASHGHDVKLIPPIYVKPFVKRGAKNDANDALGIATAVRQPGMRFVAVKTTEKQSNAMVFRTHQALMKQRTQLICALRGHLGEYGIIIAQGNTALFAFEEKMEELLQDLPCVVLETARLYYHHFSQLNQSLKSLEKQMAVTTKADQDACRLQTMPGIGPINAAAFLAFAPPMETFKRGRDFSAWLGLVPKQMSSGGKTKLGRVSKMGQSDLRRLLITGAIVCIRWAKCKGIQGDSWLSQLLNRMPVKKAAVAMANKMARILWAMVTNKEDYRGGLVNYA